MSGIVQRVARILGLRSHEDEAMKRAMQIDFRRRCSQFRQLINANNRALEAMSDIEELLNGTTPFDLLGVRTLCAQATANVFKMVRSLDGMTNGRYKSLYHRLHEIQKKIGEHVEGGRDPVAGPLVLSLHDISMANVGEAGPKMSNLGELQRMGLAVPPGFVITASAFRLFFEKAGLFDAVERLIRETSPERLNECHMLSAAIRKRVIESDLPPALESTIIAQCKSLAEQTDGELLLAVRSSAQGEDLHGASFAGQYRTKLGIRPENVIQAYKDVVASKYDVTAMVYRWRRGIPDERMAMCVGCLAMVRAEAGGVAYSLDPVDPASDTMVIHASLGLASQVVDGEGQADHYRLSREEEPKHIESYVPCKRFRVDVSDEEGSCTTMLDANGHDLPVLEEEILTELSRYVLEIERHFEDPQDVEWALDKQKKIVFLQARPMTNLDGAVQQPLADVGQAPLLDKGQPASAGVGYGPAFVAQKNSDALHFPEGAVLVVSRALPHWAPLLAHAAAVVAETGSAAGHLANVAREFGVPAVFGLENAIAVLQGMDMVTVDGSIGRVFEGRVSELLKEAHKERPLPMLGSPVHTMLTKAAQYIVPLNLLDPESPQFTPGSCQTLHDITRFCHEKSVGQLFDTKQGTSRNILAKRLRYKGAPSMYWLIDLGGAFSGSPQGKYVEFEHVVSRPFQFLWEGITVKQWAGPPAMDVKGFASIISQAASNRHLEPALASNFEVRNYFMLSDTFLSLQSRLGFHFCTLEALMAEEEEENYVSFRFKGGAANLDRRVMRAELVSDILEEHGFRTELRYDALLARAEALPEQEIATRLRVLGYVMIHTKQLDMVMKNQTTARNYENRIRTDLTTLLTGQWRSEATS